MPRMSTFERVFCQSPAWRPFTRRLVLPWALQGVRPSGHVLEIGSGSGTMAAEILDAFPDAHLTATDVDPVMVRGTGERIARFTERAGVLVGHDLPSTSPLRLLHRAEGQPFRMMTLDALRRDIAELPVAESAIRSSFIGFTVRFVVTKQRAVV